MKQKTRLDEEDLQAFIYENLKMQRKMELFYFQQEGRINYVQNRILIEEVSFFKIYLRE